MVLVNTFNDNSFIVNRTKVLAIIPEDKLAKYLDDSEFRVDDIIDDFDTTDIFSKTPVLSIRDDDNQEVFSLSNIELAETFGISWAIENGLYAEYHNGWLFVTVAWASGQAGSWAIYDVNKKELIIKGEDETPIDQLIWDTEEPKLILIRESSTYSYSGLRVITITQNKKVTETTLLSNNRYNDEETFQHPSISSSAENNNKQHDFILCDEKLYFPFRGKSYDIPLLSIM